MHTTYKNLLRAGTAALLLAALAPSAHAELIAGSFTPLPVSDSVARTDSPATPFLLAGGISQQVLFQSAGRALPGSPGSPLLDQNAINFSGPDAGRFLFTASEVGSNAGVVRFDRQTGASQVIAQNPSFTRFDLIRYTPYGTVLVAEETTRGRFFEVLNPLAAPADVRVVERPALGRFAHEGFAQDSRGNIYLGDENATGAIYRFTPSNPNAAFNPNDPSSSPLATGQFFALRIVGGGTTGVAEFVALNNADGTPIAGITDPRVDARQAVVDFNRLNPNAPIVTYNRPEDIDIRIVDGREYVYLPTTGTNQVFSLEVTNPNAPVVREFIGGNTLDLGTGAAAGLGFSAPDNVAVSAFGDVCFTEDLGGTNPVNDIFCAFDIDNNGIAESIARLATLTTNGAEPTGILFDPFQRNALLVNVQHPSNGNDLVVRLTFDRVSEPASLALFGAGLVGLGFAATRRRKA